MESELSELVAASIVIWWVRGGPHGSSSIYGYTGMVPLLPSQFIRQPIWVHESVFVWTYTICFRIESSKSTHYLSDVVAIKEFEHNTL